MALSATDFGPFQFDNTGFVSQGFDPFVTDSFTPPDNSLLVVTVATSENDTIDADMVLSGGGLTWTKAVSRQAQWELTDTAVVQVWVAEVGAASPMTLTVTHTGHDCYSMYVIPRAYTGYDTVSPTGVTGTAESRTTSVSLTLSGAPAASSEVFAAMTILPDSDSAPTFTPGSGFTEIVSPYQNNSFYGPQTQYRQGSTSTAVSWTTSAAANFGYDNKPAVAVEIKAAMGTPVDADASLTGAGALTATSSAVADAVFRSIGLGDFFAASSVLADATFSMAGSGTGDFVGATSILADAAFSMAGTGDLTTGAVALVNSDMSIGSIGRLEAVGVADSPADMFASGSSDASFIGEAVTSFVDGVFSMGGSGNLQAVGDFLAFSAFSMGGSGAFTGEGSGGLVVVPANPVIGAGGGGAGMIIPGMGPAQWKKKVKRKPRTHVMRIGEWPDEPTEIVVDPDAELDEILASLRANETGDDDDDDEALALIMSLAA